VRAQRRVGRRRAGRPVRPELVGRHGYLVARFDLAYPAARLAIEYDGDETHRHRRGPDNHRDIAAAALGWETMRFEAADVWTTVAGQYA
jgi:very-short-patch-repair endonuclease